MVRIINEKEMEKEEAYLTEAFRKLKPEARYMVLAGARSALSMEEAGRQRYTEPRNPEEAPESGPPAV
jgi:hypothetical protein